jgi:hypothetical protein
MFWRIVKSLCLWLICTSILTAGALGTVVLEHKINGKEAITWQIISSRLW